MTRSVAGALALTVALCLPTLGASAVAGTPIPAVFDFTTGSNNNISDGNSRIFSATSPNLGVFQVRATAWSLEKVNNTTYVRDSKLMVYDGGLGVISGDDDGGSNNQHTIDNYNRKDFIILQFNKPVELLSATFNTFSVLGRTKDSDATIKYGWTTQNWNSGLDLNDKTQSVLDAMFKGTYTNLSPAGANGASNTRNINPNGYWGNIWLIGADFTNQDGLTDGFKLTGLTVVPEAPTWAMLIGGFAFVGVAARRQSRPKAVQA